MQKLKIFPLLALFTFLAACVQTQELETLGIINTRGVDLYEEESSDEMLETTLIVFQFDIQHSAMTNTIIEKGKTIKGARKRANYHISYNLVPGQISVELFGRELAERGLYSYLNGLIRDARDNDTAYFAITDSTAKEVLTAGQENVAINIGQYLQNLIEKEMDEGRLPETSVTRFGHMQTEIGIDPVLPIIDLVNNKPTLTGLAVFQEDKYVDRISMKDALLVNLMKKTLKDTLIEITLPAKPFAPYIQFDPKDDVEEISLMLTILKGKSKISLTDKENLQYETDINLRLNVNEISRFITINEKSFKLLEKEIEKKLKKDYETLLKKLQEINSDVIGYGKYYAATLREKDLTNEEWREKFPEISVKYNVKVKIENYGTIM